MFRPAQSVSAPTSGFTDQVYRTVFEMAEDAILLVRDGVFIDCNQKSQIIFGAPRDALIGSGPAAYSVEVQPDGRRSAEAAPALLEAAARGESQRFEWRHLRPDGSVVDTEVVLNRVELPDGPAVLGICRDVSAARSAQARLRDSERQLRTVVGSFPLVVFAIGADGRFTMSEGQGLGKLGLRPADLVGRSIFDVYQNAPDLTLATRSVLSGVPFRGRVEVDGVHFLMTMLPQRDPAGGFGVVGVAADVTDDVEREGERQRLEAQLFEARRMETIGMLAGGVAHDFNNLLNALMGNLELAIDEVAEGSTAHESISDALGAAEHAAELTEQMLTYAGKARLQMERVDTPALLEAFRPCSKDLLPAAAQLVWSVGSPLPKLRADPERLRQVLTGLVSNAAEALDGGQGRVEVRVTAYAPGKEVLERTRLGEPPPPGPFVCIEVEDDGVGMDPDTSRRALEPFFSTKFTGRGLGMSAVAGIVRSHGGALLIDSARGSGTKVRVYLPCESIEGLARGEGERTVLVVDADPAVRTLSERMIGRLGFEVVCVPSPEAGYEILERRGDIGCLLLDLVISGDEIETLERFRAVRPELEIILASGHGFGATAPDLRAHGVRAVLDKPFRLADLRRTLSMVLD